MAARFAYRDQRGIRASIRRDVSADVARPAARSEQAAPTDAGTRISGRRCEFCQWWIANGDDRWGDKLGECRGSPPQIASNSGRGVWPETAAHQFCGAYRAREALIGHDGRPKL